MSLTKTILSQDTAHRQEVATVRMLEKAATLYQAGYRAELIGRDLYHVHSPKGLTKPYVVNVGRWNCDCFAFQSGQVRDTKNRCSCKHISGVRKLASDQCREEAREAFVQLCCDRVAYREGWTDKVLQGVGK